MHFGLFLWHSLLVGSILHLINEGLAVGEGTGNEGSASCHILRGYDGGVGVAALVIRGDFIPVSYTHLDESRTMPRTTEQGHRAPCRYGNRVAAGPVAVSYTHLTSPS